MATPKRKHERTFRVEFNN